MNRLQTESGKLNFGDIIYFGKYIFQAQLILFSIFRIFLIFLQQWNTQHSRKHQYFLVYKLHIYKKFSYY